MAKLVIGCGYLGRRVAKLWRDSGEKVFATTRNPGYADEFTRQGWQPVICDVVDPESLANLPQVETVLYCIGLDRAAGKSMREVYVDGLKNVLESLPEPERLIYVSSTSVYGQTEGEEVDETSATEPLDDNGKVVLDAERTLFAKQPGAIILRFGGIYGPGRLLREKAIVSGVPLVTNADKWLNLIHVEDGSSAVLAAQANGRSGEIYNICDNQPVQRRDFYTQLAKVLHAPTPQFVQPQPGDAVSGRERSNRRISNKKMLAELKVNLKYPGFAEGLEKGREENQKS